MELIICILAIISIIIICILAKSSLNKIKTNNIESDSSYIGNIAKQADLNLAVQLINKTFSDAVLPNNLTDLLTVFVETPTIYNAEQLMQNYPNFIEFFEMSGNPLNSTSSFIPNYLKSNSPSTKDKVVIDGEEYKIPEYNESEIKELQEMMKDFENS